MIAWTLLLLGAFGAGGAIDTDKSLLVPVLLILLSIPVGLLEARHDKRKEEMQKRDRNTGGSNCHNYPAGLNNLHKRAN